MKEVVGRAMEEAVAVTLSSATQERVEVLYTCGAVQVVQVGGLLAPFVQALAFHCATEFPPPEGMMVGSAGDHPAKEYADRVGGP